MLKGIESKGMYRNEEDGDMLDHHIIGDLFGITTTRISRISLLSSPFLTCSICLCAIDPIIPALFSFLRLA